ncbi:MAG: universal stress protein [Balneolaceae bacterium]|nr:MAG: universal stress protein [Balneolaceae bacterium]
MGLKFKHALVALDQSEASDLIADSLSAFKQLGTSKFTLFTSVSISYPGSLSSKKKSNLENKLNIYKLHLATHGFDVNTEVRAAINAYTPEQILKAAHDSGANYIIMANRGYNKLRELLLGSTATELLQRCDLPVYLMKLSVSDESEMSERRYSAMTAGRKSLEKILFPTDFSTTSDRAFEVVKEFGAKAVIIDILHVQATGRSGMNDPKMLEQFDRTDTERLRELQFELRELTNAEVSIKVRYGAAVNQILEQAENSGSTLIVMGSQGRGYVEDIFMGGVCHQVVRKSPIPVLTIPAHRAENT